MMRRFVLLLLLFPFSSIAFTTLESPVTRRGIKKGVVPTGTARYHPLLHADVAAGGAQPAEADEGGSSTLTASIFNLVKGIVGAGVLSLPAGIAAFGNAPSAVIPASLLITLIGSLSGYCFSLIGRVCSMTGATSYKRGWDEAVGTKTSWLPAVSVLMMTVSAVLAYSMILADTGKALLSTVGVATTRTQTLLGITTIILLPLCWLKNLSSLAPFSLLGSLGMLYTTIAMGARYVQKAYKLPGGKFVVSPEFQPSFGEIGAKGVLSANSFILISMLSTAFMAHFNAAKFKNDLQNSTLKRYNTVVAVSFGISILIFSLIASLGFLTFGGASNGLILNNYATSDTLMGLSRIAVAISLVFSYPLAFTGVKEGVLDFFNIKDRSNSMLNKVTLVCLSLVTLAAAILQDVSFVLAFTGATIGNALIYIFPAFMFRGSVKKMGDGASKSLKREATAAIGTALLGTGMGLIGATMAVKSIIPSK